MQNIHEHTKVFVLQPACSSHGPTVHPHAVFRAGAVLIWQPREDWRLGMGDDAFIDTCLEVMLGSVQRID